MEIYMLSQSTLDAIQYISKLVSRGLTPKQAEQKLLSDPNYRCSKGYTATKGAVSQARKRVERRLAMEEAMEKGVTTFINGKPKQ
jgi:hypothetical protein